MQKRKQQQKAFIQFARIQNQNHQKTNNLLRNPRALRSIRRSIGQTWNKQARTESFASKLIGQIKISKSIGNSAHGSKQPWNGEKARNSTQPAKIGKIEQPDQGESQTTEHRSIGNNQQYRRSAGERAKKGIN
jgi:hypothetical protein